jgi:hypothetical protein
MDTNDIIRQFHKAAPHSKLVKTKKASNPLVFYEEIYERIGNSKKIFIPSNFKSIEIAITKGPLGWFNLYMDTNNPPSVKQIEKLIKMASYQESFVPNVLFIEIQEDAIKKFKTPKKFTYKDENGNKYNYKLDAVVLRDIEKYHFSAYVTINGKDYGFDGSSYSRLEPFDWKKKLNKNTKWRFADQYETYFNFTKGYNMLIYYREK